MLPRFGSASGDEYGPIQPGLVNTNFVDALPPTGARQGARSEVCFFQIRNKQHRVAPCGAHNVMAALLGQSG